MRTISRFQFVPTGLRWARGLAHPISRQHTTGCPTLRDFRRVGTVLPAPPVLTLGFYATSRMFFHYGVILKTVPYPSCPVSVRT